MALDDYSRLEHLKMIQAVIVRMAQNSFILKGWSVTLVTAMMALAVSDRNRGYAALALFPALVFWGLDAYYLRQERLFRALHDSVCSRDADQISPFSLSTKAASGKVIPWWKTFWAPTVLAPHLAVLIVIAFVLISLFKR